MRISYPGASEEAPTAQKKNSNAPATNLTMIALIAIAAFVAGGLATWFFTAQQQGSEPVVSSGPAGTAPEPTESSSADSAAGSELEVGSGEVDRQRDTADSESGFDSPDAVSSDAGSASEQVSTTERSGASSASGGGSSGSQAGSSGAGQDGDASSEAGPDEAVEGSDGDTGDDSEDTSTPSGDEADAGNATDVGDETDTAQEEGGEVESDPILCTDEDGNVILLQHSESCS